MDNILTLINIAQTQNEYGVWEQEYIPRKVFCQVHGVTRSEFYNAGRNGLNPQFEFTVFAGDYEGETICQFEGKSYAIYRTFIIPGTDYIELYVERHGGTNGIEAESCED